MTMTVHNIYELDARYDSRQSFYGKARIIDTDEGLKLQSYDTIVAEIKHGKATVFGTYSPTTLRHIKEFLKQNRFKVESKSQIENDYLDN